MATIETTRRLTYSMTLKKDVSPSETLKKLKGTLYFERNFTGDVELKDGTPQCHTDCWSAPAGEGKYCLVLEWQHKDKDEEKMIRFMGLLMTRIDELMRDKVFANGIEHWGVLEIWHREPTKEKPKS